MNFLVASVHVGHGEVHQLEFGPNFVFNVVYFLVYFLQNLTLVRQKLLNLDGLTIDQLKQAVLITVLLSKVELSPFVVHSHMDHPYSEVILLDQGLDQVNVYHAVFGAAVYELLDKVVFVDNFIMLRVLIRVHIDDLLDV